ncbi:uncharacterized protein PG986_006570 [Apiospora aurea]|uniref:Uncharacterized protein n=1 Tax=Apiospora aurea TaxID=335848 RepID=A0ABR1QKS8_9PEZI
MEAAAAPRTYWAKALADRFQHPEPKLFRYEFVVECAIPEDWVNHKISLETLMHRGLDWERHLSPFTATWTMDSLLVSIEQGQLCSITRYFGARAPPMGWIEKQLFRDLFRPKKSDVNIWTRYGDVVFVDAIDDFERGFDAGTEDVLVDWVTSSEFLSDLADYEEGKDRLLWRLMDDPPPNHAETKALSAEFDLLEAEAVRMGF